MAHAAQKADKELTEITECPICMSAFTDPRMLPCIHTFCFQCLKQTAEEAELKPGDKMPCPLCRKDFIIPENGTNGVQKNFFMENLLEFKTTLQMGSNIIICDMCNIRNEGKSGQLPKATMICLECQDNFCDSCVKVHQFQKVTKYHQVVNIGSDMISERKRLVSVKSCTKHTQKPLDYYCADCKKIVCVSCFVESHELHDCKDVSTVDEEFRQTIEKKALQISSYLNEMLLMRNNNEQRKAVFLEEIIEKEKDIHKRNHELKDVIDRHTKSLLDALSVIKLKHLKEMKNQMEEIERCCTILSSFEAYCTELRSKGSASDICSSVDGLIFRADDIVRDHEAFIGRPPQSVEVSFQVTELGDVLQNANSNFVGSLEVTTAEFENYAVVVGINDGATITKEVIKINLHRPNEISIQERIPTQMTFEAAAAVYCNTMYVTGIGPNIDEIWKHNHASGWMKCASLVQGRLRHSAAFIDEVLYICGGYVHSNKSVLDSVEAYGAVSNKCATVGKLIHSVQSASNCVPFKSSLYIFSGTDKDYNAFNHVQVYNTKLNICTLLSKPLPRSYNLMRAVLWETSVILLGRYTCFIFNFETEMWQEREKFKTDVVHFGLALENGRIFVIGGGKSETDKNGENIMEEDEYDEDMWKCRDDVRYVPLQNILQDKAIEWKIHGKLPKPCLVQACANMRLLV